jgi:putative ABC transport system substrate-binding protein
MRRREFITLLGGMAALRPLGARAQADSVRRIGVLSTLAADDRNGQARIEAFRLAFQQLGWVDGRNARIEIRWAGAGANEIRKNAAELVALAPDVILTSGAAGVGPLLEATRKVPIVFVLVADPVGAGFVDSLARPGGNATGFAAVEFGFGGKLLELLKEIAPDLKRAAVIRDAAISAGIGIFGAIQSAAPMLGVEVVPVNVRDPSEMERTIVNVARGGHCGLIVTSSALAFSHRDLIIGLAAQHRLPSVYFSRPFVSSGGLISYSPDLFDQYRRAASYVDRILKGERAADLPVQAPTKFDLVVNLKTAKTLGLDIPDSVLARADEVIE